MQNEPKCKGRQVQTRNVRWKPDYSTNLDSGMFVYNVLYLEMQYV